jgi:transposase InsO family protein
VKFRFILAEKACFAIVFMCRQLDVSRSGFYGWRSRGESARKATDRRLAPLIRAEFLEHPRGCGSRPVVQALREQGHGVSRKRAVRLMAQEGLRHRLKRRFARTTDSSHKKRVAKNVLARNFEAGPPNKSWAGDITYIHTKRGWAYLAAILDLGSRKVVGWTVSTSLDQELALEALRRAIASRRPPPGLVHHSDRGVQYTADDYRALLAEHGLISSMSRKGNCWDNAVAESFFSTLKRELPNDHVFEDCRDVERSVFAYVEAYYNTRRRHSALGYVAPNEYERLNAG